MRTTSLFLLAFFVACGGTTSQNQNSDDITQDAPPKPTVEQAPDLDIMIVQGHSDTVNRLDLFEVGDDLDVITSDWNDVRVWRFPDRDPEATPKLLRLWQNARVVRARVGTTLEVPGEAHGLFRDHALILTESGIEVYKAGEWGVNLMAPDVDMTQFRYAEPIVNVFNQELGADMFVAAVDGDKGFAIRDIRNQFAIFTRKDGQFRPVTLPDTVQDYMRFDLNTLLSNTDLTSALQDLTADAPMPEGMFQATERVPFWEGRGIVTKGAGMTGMIVDVQVAVDGTWQPVQQAIPAVPEGLTDFRALPDGRTVLYRTGQPTDPWSVLVNAGDRWLSLSEQVPTAPPAVMIRSFLNGQGMFLFGQDRLTRVSLFQQEPGQWRVMSLNDVSGLKSLYAEAAAGNQAVLISDAEQGRVPMVELDKTLLKLDIPPTAVAVSATADPLDDANAESPFGPFFYSAEVSKIEYVLEDVAVAYAEHRPVEMRHRREGRWEVLAPEGLGNILIDVKAAGDDHLAVHHIETIGENSFTYRLDLFRRSANSWQAVDLPDVPSYVERFGVASDTKIYLGDNTGTLHVYEQSGRAWRKIPNDVTFDSTQFATISSSLGDSGFIMSTATGQQLILIQNGRLVDAADILPGIEPETAFTGFADGRGIIATTRGVAQSFWRQGGQWIDLASAAGLSAILTVNSVWDNQGLRVQMEDGPDEILLVEGERLVRLDEALNLVDGPLTTLEALPFGGVHGVPRYIIARNPQPVIWQLGDSQVTRVDVPGLSQDASAATSVDAVSAFIRDEGRGFHVLATREGLIGTATPASANDAWLIEYPHAPGIYYVEKSGEQSVTHWYHRSSDGFVELGSNRFCQTRERLAKAWPGGDWRIGQDCASLTSVSHPVVIRDGSQANQIPLPAAWIHRDDSTVWHRPLAPDERLASWQRSGSQFILPQLLPEGIDVMAVGPDGTTLFYGFDGQKHVATFSQGTLEIDLEAGLIYNRLSDGRTRVHRLSDPSRWIWMFADPARGRVYFDDRGYYYNETDAIAKLVSFRNVNEVYTFEQYAAYLFRPDKLEERLGVKPGEFFTLTLRDELLIERALELSAGGTVDIMALTPPEVSINREAVPVRVSEPYVDIPLRATGEQLAARNVEIRVVGLGKVDSSDLVFVTGDRNVLSVNRRIPLQAGENLIEVRVTDANELTHSRRLSVTYEPEEPQLGDLWLAVIATGDYDFPGIADLPLTQNDGETIGGLFDDQLGIAYNEIHRRTWCTRGDCDGVPTREALAEEVPAFLAGMQPYDYVVVYLSGHGTARNSHYFYLPANAHPELLDQSAVSWDELTQWVTSLPLGRKMLILDTCQSGAFTHRDLQERYIQQAAERDGLYVLSASAADAVAFEVRDLGNGLFTYVLNEGMRSLSADGNADARISFQELGEYVGLEVRRMARELLDAEQEPFIPYVGERLDYILARDSA